MTSTLLRTRLHRPPLPLVCSPAGFGKGTVVSAWLSSSNQPGAWISPDQKDDDAGLFLQYFITAVTDVAREACVRSARLLDIPIKVGQAK